MSHLQAQRTRVVAWHAAAQHEVEERAGLLAGASHCDHRRLVRHGRAKLRVSVVAVSLLFFRVMLSVATCSVAVGW